MKDVMKIQIESLQHQQNAIQKTIKFIKNQKNKHFAIEMETGTGKTFTFISTIFEIASKSHEIFKSSRTAEKRQILKILFSNLSLDSKNLDYTYRKPFNLFVNLERSQQWSG